MSYSEREPVLWDSWPQVGDRVVLDGEKPGVCYYVFYCGHRAIKLRDTDLIVTVYWGERTRLTKPTGKRGVK